MNEPQSSPGTDVLTQISHKLIRTACRDDFDPFMLGTPPENSGPIVRACFYYAVVVTPRHTVVFDNQGRGGMCRMVPEEMVAVWDTNELLKSQGVALEDLNRMDWMLGDNLVPSPLEIHNDFPDESMEPVMDKGKDEEIAWAPQFAGRVSLMKLLTKDVELVRFLFGSNPSIDSEPSASHRRPKMS